MALHVTTDIGKPGKREREETFYGKEGAYEEDRRGRRFIQHGIGEQPEWIPHARQIDIQHSEKGQLDWVSRVRSIPEKLVEPHVREEVSLPRIRCFPGKYQRSETEWTAYPEGFKQGKKCRFEVQGLTYPVPLASNISTQEISHFMRFGNKRTFSSYWEKRGGIPCAAFGDKTYQAPEYSKKFHNFGSTRPIVCFGGPLTTKPDTFVPLQDSAFDHSDCYKFRERRRRIQEEVDHVSGLEDWSPAAVLVPPVVWEDGRKTITTTIT